MGRLTLGAALALVLVLPAGAAAAVVTIPASMDNTLYESPTGALGNGAGDYFFAGRTNHPVESPDNPSGRRGLFRRGLVAFDVAAAVPAGSVVEAVELQLYVSNVRLDNPPGELEVPVSLHRVEAGWGEGASDAVQQEGAGALAQPGDATWVHRFFDGAAWASPGGDFAAAPSATTTVGDKFATYSWTGTGLVGDVQGWLDEPGSNFGWLVLGDESAPSTAKRFNGLDHPSVETRPALRVTYQPVPEAGVGILLTLAAVVVWLSGRRRSV